VADSLSTATTRALHDAARQGQAAGLTVEIGRDALQTPVSDTAVIYSLAVAAAVLSTTSGALAAGGVPLLIAFMGWGSALPGSSRWARRWARRPRPSHWR
jgi:putative drug exporter of the RND superfamily